MGSPNRDEVLITADPLPLGGLAPRVVCPTAGAIATFIGTTRDNFEGKQVVRLEVSACARPSVQVKSCPCFDANACACVTFVPVVRSLSADGRERDS
jgi:hypothetical protein